jgi:hypothetical protein
MKVMPRKELLRQLKLFKADKKRGITFKNFALIAGISYYHLNSIVAERLPMTELSQKRLSKALNEFKLGKVATIEHVSGRTEPVYRQKPVPLARKSMGLTVKNGQITISVGMRQLGDYSRPTLGELLDKPR